MRFRGLEALNDNLETPFILCRSQRLALLHHGRASSNSKISPSMPTAAGAGGMVLPRRARFLCSRLRDGIQYWTCQARQERAAALRFPSLRGAIGFVGRATSTLTSR